MVPELPLKFGQNRASNSLDIANIKFVWVVVLNFSFETKYKKDDE